ncbi:MAG: hypothetical protein WC384_03035 [Prolixibacteraceae bacterium]|jgi:putative lipoprotein (rSAM/lipoprotein system)
MRRSWITKLIGGLSFTSAMFVFQACYGTPQDFGLDVFIEGQVKSESTGIAIKGIKVSVDGLMQYEYTDENGKFSFYTERGDSYKIKFEDIDSAQNGAFANKDTILSAIDKKVYLNIALDSK